MNLKGIWLSEKTVWKSYIYMWPLFFRVWKNKALEIAGRSASGPLPSSPQQTLPYSLGNFNITWDHHLETMASRSHYHFISYYHPPLQSPPSPNYPELPCIRDLKLQSRAITFKPSSPYFLLESTPTPVPTLASCQTLESLATLSFLKADRPSIICHFSPLPCGPSKRICFANHEWIQPLTFLCPFLLAAKCN